MRNRWQDSRDRFLSYIIAFPSQSLGDTCCCDIFYQDLQSSHPVRDVKAALLPQSCCQTCPMFRRQQLTLFSSHSFYIQRQQRQRRSPVCPTSSAKGLFAVYLPFFKLVFILLPWQCLFLQDAGKRLELGILFLALLLAPSGYLWGWCGGSLTSGAELELPLLSLHASVYHTLANSHLYF